MRTQHGGDEVDEARGISKNHKGIQRRASTSDCLGLQEVRIVNHAFTLSPTSDARPPTPHHLVPVEVPIRPCAVRVLSEQCERLNG